MFRCHNSKALWKSVAAGAVGGFIASFAMNQFQSAITAVSKAAENKKRERKVQPKQEKRNENAGDDATVKTADAISAAVFDHKLEKDEKKWAGPAVHYAFGTTLGAAYGSLATCSPVEIGAGTIYGAAVWLGADEVAVPILGLSKPPNQTPASGHAQALASHLIFGLVTHFTRRLLLKL